MRFERSFVIPVYRTLFPGVERRGPRTIAVTDSDYVRAFKLTWGCLIVGMASFEGLL